MQIGTKRILILILMLCAAARPVSMQCQQRVAKVVVICLFARACVHVRARVHVKVFFKTERFENSVMVLFGIDAVRPCEGTSEHQN